MRWIVLAAVLLAQPDTMTGPWVGPLENKGKGAIPTDVDLTETNGQIAGNWRSRPPNTGSGTITGTRAKLEVVFYTDADTAEAERCQARYTFTGRVTEANIYRLTSTKIDSTPNPRKVCGPWPTDLVWLLQRAH